MQLLKKHGVLMEGSSPLWARPATHEHVRMRTDRRRLCGSLFFTVGVGGTEACPLQRTQEAVAWVC